MTAAAALDPAHTALVLVDLMERIAALPVEPRKCTEVLAVSEELAAAFRAAGAPVVLIRAERPGVAEQPPGSGLAEGLLHDGDIEIVKRMQRRVLTLVDGRLVRDQPAGRVGRLAWAAWS